MSENENIVYDLISIGAGPAGLTAAIYASRENMKVLLIEKGVIGGLAAVTDKVDNYPGFEDGIEGLKLAQSMRAQAERFGANIELDEISNIQKKDNIFTLTGYAGEYKTKSVLIATGSAYNKLMITGEDEYYGRGVHYCATCDGAFYQGKKLVVVGSGNSAAQEALFLTRFATKIDVLIRGDAWKASSILVDEVSKNDKIKVHFNVSTTEVETEDKRVIGIKAKDSKTGKDIHFPTDGIFVFVGLKPNTSFLAKEQFNLDQFGFVLTDQNLQTNMAGVFSAGDVRSTATMQIASATGEGATAALKIREYLESVK